MEGGGRSLMTDPTFVHPVEIVEWSRAVAEHRLGVGALFWSDRHTVVDPTEIRRAQRLGQPLAPYVALFAIEDGQPRAHVWVERREWRGSSGREAVCVITDVATRSDRLRKGYASALIREVHRREREDGRRLSFLWTHKTWGAHVAYEALGYRDVFSDPSAIREPRVRKSTSREGYADRPGRKSDAGLLETLFDASTGGRWGFLPRSRGILRLRFEMGWHKPRDYHILLFRGTPVGYFRAHVAGWHLFVNEALVSGKVHLPALLDAIESLGGGKWICLDSTTFTHEAKDLLRERGFDVIPNSHRVLMAASLAGEARLDAVVRTCESGRYSSHNGDMF